MRELRIARVYFLEETVLCDHLYLVNARREFLVVVDYIDFHIMLAKAGKFFEFQSYQGILPISLQLVSYYLIDINI